MDRQTLIRKLDNMLEEAARLHTWGLIEIDLKDGVPTLLRKTVQEKLANVEDRPHANYRR